MKKNDSELEDFGIMTEEYDENTPKYNIKQLLEYCKRKGVEPSELKDEERDQFRTN